MGAAKPALPAGGNPQIAKADGDAPVQAYIAVMPGWKRDVGRRLNALIVRNVPNLRKAVKRPVSPPPLVLHGAGEGRRTRWCSEREPADSLRGKSNVLGGRLPSLTSALAGLEQGTNRRPEAPARQPATAMCVADRILERDMRVAP